MTKVEDEVKIKELQEKFEKKLSVNIRPVKLLIGFRGDSGYKDVFYSEELGMWFYFGKEVLDDEQPTPRYYNIFGVNPTLRSPNNIICQINFPKRGKTRRVNSFFFVDESGKIYVYHNGRFTNNDGMKISDFFDKLDSKYKNKIEKIAGNRVFLIGSLDSDDFAKDVKNFVYEVKRIKSLWKKSS